MTLKLLAKQTLQPVTVEETDELIAAIDQDPLGDGDTWDLHQEIDADRLNDFLDSALKDAKTADSTANKA
jgi:hypothetical protein